MQLRPIDQPDGPKKELNYYHCTLADIPFDLPMQQIVDMVTPKEDSEELKALLALGYALIPHQLHVFKERLPKKFAMVNYFLLPVQRDEQGSIVVEGKVDAATLEMRKEAHVIVTKYLSSVHVTGVEGVIFKLAQPFSLLNSVPFLERLDAEIAMLNVEQCADVKKLRTWVLTKADLDQSAAFAADSTQHLGSVSSSSILPAEWAWLRTQHKQFPQTATSDLITTFFVRCLHPFFTYKDTVTVSHE
eukprot:GILI01020879.1.p1 GENE.GILI01020879.1~~GILI01020879.1.p1  ORF type:complete len:246 (+),score=34.95 GILI01020879.1:84-821(+)